MGSALELSVVVPVFNEERSVEPLVSAVRRTLGDGKSWEMLLVDDGSVDGTAEVIEELARSDRRIRLISLARNYGQSAAMQAGFDHARGAIVVSMDGDLQNDPGDIPSLVAKLNEGYDLVAGFRQNRKDRLLTRRVPSWIANRIIHRMTGVPIRDNGCSLKAYRRELLERIRLYSDMHRFIPAVAAGMAGARISQMPVRHHPRRFGTSKYGLARVFQVLGDLLVIQMIRFFRERPLLMFSSGALLSGVLGLIFAIAAGIVIARFPVETANSQVLPGSSLLWFGLACHLFMLGLLAEVAVRKAREIGSDPQELSVEGVH